MKSSSSALLKAVIDGVTDQKNLLKILNIRKRQFDNVVRDLTDQNYIERSNSTIKLRSSPKTILLRDVSKQYDIEKLLYDSNEQILYNLTEPTTTYDLQHITNLSIATVFRAISELESIGAIEKKDNKRFIDKDTKLYLFANLLKTEKENSNVEQYAEVIYQDQLRTLKMVPKDMTANGELTAFSLFSYYGIEYHTAYNYYIKQDKDLKLEDVLIHAIVSSSKEKDKNGLAVIIIFYLKNKLKLDLLDVRKTAKSYNVSDIWYDIEAFLRNNQIKNLDLFPTWKEFQEKAELYSISTEEYVLPEAYPTLFDELGKKVTTNVDVYLLGGENMRIKKLKDRTKDCDLVVKSDKALEIIVIGLESIGYQSINRSNLSPEDVRINASDILKHPTRSRVDIFNRIIAEKLILSQEMIDRSEIKEFCKLKLGILSNEDIFLLKSVTEREGDIHDMAKIVQAGKFDWNIVWDELLMQERTTLNYFSSVLLENIDDLYEQTNIKPPFYRKLIRHVMENEINKQIRNGPKSLNEIVTSLKGKDISEKLIRNRIDYLIKKKFLLSTHRNGEVFLGARKRNLLNFPAVNVVDIKDKLLRYVQTFSTQLNLGEKMLYRLRHSAIDLANSADIQGLRPRNLVAGMIYLFTKEYDVKIKAKDIALIANVSPASLSISSENVRLILSKKSHYSDVIEKFSLLSKLDFSSNRLPHSSLFREYFLIDASGRSLQFDRDYQFMLDHIKSGYPNIWKLWIEIKLKLDQYNLSIREMKDLLEKEVKNIFRISYPHLKTETSSSVSNFEDAFLVDHISELVYQTIERDLIGSNSLANPKIEYEAHDGKEYYLLRDARLFIKTSVKDEVDIKRFLDIIKNLSQNKELMLAVRSQNSARHDLRDLINEFQGNLNQSVSAMRISNQIKGSCSRCIENKKLMLALKR